MLKRIYIDNYKCLVNFELAVGPINLLLGPNGSGKTSVFEILQILQFVIGGDGRVSDLFDITERTRWQHTPIQVFELDLGRDEDTYKYELAVQFNEKTRIAGIKYERLWFNSQPLLKFENQEVQLYYDDFSAGSKYPFGGSQSALGSMIGRDDNQLLTWFKEQVSRFVIVKIYPILIVPGSIGEERRPTFRLDNFVSWYRYLSQDQGFAFQLTAALQEVLPGFEYFKFLEAGEKYRELYVFFKNAGKRDTVEGYGFKELSDGQRILIMLYTLLHAAKAKKLTLFLDEPENYLALPEIQPWLIQLYDQCQEQGVQALLISHHPELINYLLASPGGYWFERQDNLHTRVKPITAEADGGVPVSELIARGWLNG